MLFANIRSKDGEVLSSTKRIQVVDGEKGRHALTISVVESSDGGRYTVRAFNDFGESRFTATLLVRGQTLGSHLKVSTSSLIHSYVSRLN